MGEGPRRCLALLVFTVLFASCAAFAPSKAAADSTDPGSSAEQTSSSSASSSAQNDNSTTQSATVTQSGGDGGGAQSQTIAQNAPVQQSARASAASTQNGTKLPARGSASPRNDFAAGAAASDANHP